MNRKPWSPISMLRSFALVLFAALLCIPCVAVGQTYQSIASAINDALPTNGSAGNLTITKPAGTASGDVMLATISARPSAMTINPPAGWALYKRTEQPNGGVSTAPGGMTLLTYYKAAGGAEPANYTWTLANPQNDGGGVVGTITRVSGVDTANPIDVYVDALTGNGLVHSAPSVTTTVPNTLLVASITYLSSRNFGAPSGIAGITERAEVRAPTSDNAIGITLLVATVPKASAGATGTVSATAAGDADYGMGHMFALAAPRPDLTLAMTRTGNLDPSTTTSYFTLTASNAGTVNETATVTVTTTLSANVSYTSNTGSDSGWSCGSAGSPVVVTCTRSGLNASASASLRLNVSVGASASGTLTTTATIAGAANNDGNTTNNSASDSYTIVPNYCTTSAVGADTLVTCTGDGTVTIPSGVTSVRYLVVGGGGGGGGIGTDDEDGAGGGGAGGVLRGSSFAVTAGATYSVTVGSGGTAGTGSANGSNGNSSTFSTLTAYGGGGGAREGGYDGLDGGSGGGGSDNDQGGIGILGQGNNGGNGNNNDAGGGGGGAGAVGQNGGSNNGGDGGNGVSDDITGAATYYGGGGGGGADDNATGGAGGSGGGGAGAVGRGPGSAGTANTGGGGGGATGSSSGAAYSGGAGGSGVVIVRYVTSDTGPNHYVISHSGTALTCEAEPVTITGHDSAHARISVAGKTISLTTSSSKGTWSAAADNCTQACYDATNTAVACMGTFAATGSNAGTATYLFATGEAAVRLCLKHNTTGTVSVNVTDGTATEASGTASAETSPGADPGLVFSDTGLRFYASDTVDTLGNLVAGLRSDVTDATYQPAPQTLTIRALKSSETSPARCVSLLGGAPTSKTIQFAYQCLDPNTCHASSAGLEVNGTAVAGSGGVPTPTSDVTVAFNASGYGSINLKYWDVGQIKLYARGSIADPATGGTVAITTGASNSFLVKPYGFSVMACTSATPCTVANTSNTDGTGSVFSTAGTTFNATIKALAYGGSVVTPSFGLGTANGTESVGLTRTLVAPTPGGAAGTLGGTIAILRSSFSDGVASVSDLTWNEVGVITLSATNSTFEGTALSPTATGTSGNIGRFIPDHFETVVTGPMSCGALPFAPACPAGGLVYSGQAFTTTVTAYTLGGTGALGVTTNYAGSFAKLVTLGAWDAVGSTAQQNPPASGGATTFNPTVTAASFTAGEATTTTPAYTFAIPSTSTTPPAAPTNVYIRAIDADTPAVSSLRTPSASSVEGGVKVVNGRLRMANAYGSERLPLSVLAEVQYYDGANWLTNTQDSSSPPSPWAVDPNVSTALVGTGGTGNTTPTLGTSLSSGLASLSASAPGAGGFGYLNLTVTVPAYLQFRWAGCAVPTACVAGDFIDPTSRVSFGIYKGNNRIIYRRERYY